MTTADTDADCTLFEPVRRCRIVSLKTFAVCSGAADLVILMDSSGSIDIDDWNKEVQFVIDVISNLYIGPDGVHVAIITYDRFPVLVMGLTQYLDKYDIINVLQNLEFNEGPGDAFILN